MSKTITLRNKKTGKTIKLRKKDVPPMAAIEEEPVRPVDERPSVLSRFVRAFMRTSPIEQMRTAQHNLEQMQEGNFPDPSDPDFNEKYEDYIRPREEAIMRKGAAAQFGDLATAGLMVSGIANPLATLKVGGKFALLEGLANVSGLNKGIANIPNPELRDVAEITKFGVEGAVAMKPWKVPKPIKTGASNLAGRMINSLIKPRHKHFLFGKEPGKAVAKEGLVATNLRSLKDKIVLRKQQLNTAIRDTRIAPENAGKTVDASKALKPLVTTYSKLRRAGKRTHAAELQRIANAFRDLNQSGKNLKKLSIADAYRLKQNVSTMQNWNSESEASRAVNAALRRTYHNFDIAIDRKIPQLAQLNDRVANLISAEQAINFRIEALMKSEPMPTVFKVMDLPFAGVKSPAVKTLLAKMLAQQYKKTQFNLGIK